MTNEPPTTLLIASDTVGPRMAGSGIRYWNLARTIGLHQSVTLATPAPVRLEAPTGVTIVPYGSHDANASEQGARLAKLMSEHEVVVAQHVPYLYIDPEILASRYLVVDLYAPWILEKLEYSRIDPERGEPDRDDDVEILNRLLEIGDFFICASERQRDFWLGALVAAGRPELEHVKADPELRNLIDVVSFGLPDKRPLPNGPGPRDNFAGIGRNDPLLLWNGGLWNWLDPLTAIRAVGLLANDDPRIRLVFMGTRSPGAQVAEMDVVEDAKALARELNLLSSNIFFNDWVAYDDRQNWLLQANVTLSLHQPTVEARFAFRTRIMDNIWCGVPIVATEGDVLADLVQAEQIGFTVASGDAVEVARAISNVLQPEIGRKLRQNLATLRSHYTWERVSEPLLRYCGSPWRMGVRRGQNANADYVHKLERLYSETAKYARELERVVDEKNAALETAMRDQSSTFFSGILGRRRRI